MHYHCHHCSPRSGTASTSAAYIFTPTLFANSIQQPPSGTTKLMTPWLTARTSTVRVHSTCNPSCLHCTNQRSLFRSRLQLHRAAQLELALRRHVSLATRACRQLPCLIYRPGITWTVLTTRLSRATSSPSTSNTCSQSWQAISRPCWCQARSALTYVPLRAHQPCASLSALVQHRMQPQLL